MEQKITKKFSLIKVTSLILSLSLMTTTTQAKLLDPTFFDIDTDSAVEINSIINDAKAKDISAVKESVCSFEPKMIGVEMINEYCKDSFDEGLELMRFKTEIKNMNSNAVIKIPELRTNYGVSLAYSMLWERVKVNERYFALLNTINKANEGKNLTNEEKEEISKKIRDFVESDFMKATDIEYKKFKDLFNQLNKVKGEIASKELQREVNFKKKFLDKKMYIMSNDKYELIFKKEESLKNIQELDKEMSIVLKNKEMLDEFYKVIVSRKYEKVILDLQKKKEVILPMRECIFLKDYGILSRQGLNALTCKN